MCKNRWTFFSNYGHVLLYLSRHPNKVQREVAKDVGITERQVQKIVQELSEANILKKQKCGRKNVYSINEDAPLRHPLESHRTIKELVELISKK